ncbi:MAG: hypothetical protein DHS20C18_49310 [Saprospiraceae bacterium]|nr:MAG: hypothetical protein DHS20C18_49310 [Saprospiraceae bacterium]
MNNNKVPLLLHYPKVYELLSPFLKGLILLDRNGNILKADKKVEQFSGFSAERLMQMNLIDFDQELSQSQLGLYWKRLETEEKVKWRMTWGGRNKEHIVLDFEARLIDEDTSSVAICRIRPANSLHEGQDNLLEIFAQKAGVATWYWDLKEGHFGSMNFLYTLLGLSFTEYAGPNNNIIQLLQPVLSSVQFDQLMHAISRLKETRQSFELALLLETENGTKKITFYAEPVLEDNKLTAIQGVVYVPSQGIALAEPDQHACKQSEAENIYLKDAESFNFEEIITKSPAYLDVLEQLEQVAPTKSTVLIEGETGTGKELLARAIHGLSERKDRPLVKVNCAALSETLIESELFGHVKGAFTGADKDRIGRFELADQGTIFLDEIGELTPELQVKLLRVLQEEEFQRLGSNQTININVRIIAATNRDLQKMVQKKTFRQDLYYRLHVFPINSIPLRKRPQDIPLLVQYFIEKFNQKNSKQVQTVSEKDLQRLEQYDFPGNVRELQNIIERAVILSNGDVLNLSFWNPANSKKIKGNQFKSLEDVQREHIIDALERTRWRVSGSEGAARLLNINAQTLFSKMRKLNINRTI